MILVIALIVVVLTLLYYIATKHYTFWEKAGVKCLTPSTIQGAIKGSHLPDEHELYTCHPGEPYIGIIRLRTLAISVRDPELAKLILSKDFSYFHDRGMVFNEKRNVLSAHLFNLEGTKWKILRAKLTPTFSSGRLRAMFPLVKYCMDQMISVISPYADKPEAVDVSDILSRCTTDVILNCAFGMQGNCLNDKEDIYLQMVKKTFVMNKWRKLERILFMTFPSLQKYVPPLKENREITQFFLDAFGETLQQREKSGVKRNDFLELLLEIHKNGKLKDNNTDEAEDDSSFEFTYNIMVAQAFSFFVAGSETSSSASSFAIVELAHNIDIQDRLRAEIDESIKHYGGLTYQGVMGITYLDKVVSETLRKYSIAPMLVRTVNRPYPMPDGRVTLPVGTRVLIHIRSLQNDPKYFPDPDKFDPERFSREAKRNRHKYVYMPFGEGPRICIGMRFGLLQVKLAIASIVSQFEIRPKPGLPYPPVFSKKTLVTKLERGDQVLITKRKS